MWPRVLRCSAPSPPDDSESWASGAGQPAKLAACPNVMPKPLLPFFCCNFSRRASILSWSESSNSLADGVGHEPESLSDVRRADARSAEINRPDGVALVFQVSANKVEPSKAVFACNLLAKDALRSALADEPLPCRP